jgi:cell division protein FtsW (lipid II flippase)
MGLIVPFLVTLVPLGLILKEPDLGTSLLFLPVLYGMLWTAGARGWHLLLIALLGVCLLPIFWSAISAEQKSRITAVFQQRDGSAPQQGVADGYHLHQSKQVLSFGGAWGSQAQGTLIDDPAAYYLPACRTDFVLCMVGERFGLAGTLTTLFLYGVLSLSGLFVAGTSRDPFGRLLAVGVTVLLAAQTIINTGMTVGLVPITGITLPLMSYGGSSLLFTGLALGLMVQVARQPHDPMSLPASIQPRRSPSAAWQSS